MFDTFAHDESEHYQRLQIIYEKLKEKGKWPVTLFHQANGTSAQSLLQNELDAASKLPRADRDDIDAVTMAIAFETKGIGIYERLRDSADDSLEKEFYNILISLEKEHLVSLRNLYEYFQNHSERYLP